MLLLLSVITFSLHAQKAKLGLLSSSKLFFRFDRSNYWSNSLEYTFVLAQLAVKFRIHAQQSNGMGWAGQEAEVTFCLVSSELFCSITQF